MEARERHPGVAAGLVALWATGAATVAVTNLSPRVVPEPDAVTWRIVVHRWVVGTVILLALGVLLSVADILLHGLA